MTGDFFELDLTDMDINGLITKLNRIDNAVSKEVLPEVMKECGEELLKEEKRILSAKYPDSELIDPLTVMVEKTGRKTYRVKAGYSTEVIKKHIEGLIIEFGRPGTKGLKRGGTANHAEGVDNEVTGKYSHAEGQRNTVTGSDTVHIEGISNSSDGGCSYCHIEGSGNSVKQGSCWHVSGHGNEVECKSGYSMGGTVSGQDITRICEDTALPSRHSLLY